MQPAATARRARSADRSRRCGEPFISSAVPVRGGRRVDRLPVEVEVVAGLDHPARRVGDDVDVGAADRVERPPRQLRPRLAPGDVDRRDDDVEPGEQVVVVVEVAVGADLELAAVEQPEALRRRLGRRGAGGLLRARTGRSARR